MKLVWLDAKIDVARELPAPTPATLSTLTACLHSTDVTCAQCEPVHCHCGTAYTVELGCACNELPLCSHCGEPPFAFDRCESCGRDPATGLERCENRECQEPSDSLVRSSVGDRLCPGCLPELDPRTAREMERERAEYMRGGL